MKSVLSTANNFRSLSLKDLLQARDAYHYHLMNKENVVGTAVGLYLIRKTDPTMDEQKARRLRGEKTETQPKGERTLGNSEVRDYSWPCVLAFVKEWVDADAFGGPGKVHKPEEMVPKTLYLPDGRMVPVCVVKVEPVALSPFRFPDWRWPRGLFGSGMSIIAETQEVSRNATAGCLVSDGHTSYVLTSRHVCGHEGEPVYTLSGGKRVEIGVASRNHLSRLPFTEVYPEFAGQRTFVNLDVGLITVNDLNQWTSQTFGLGPTGALADLNAINITTRLIDAPVVAQGAASGTLQGRIKALFYRYKSVGGFDYVADFLIAPRPELNQTGNRVVQTQPGDSGAIWHLVTGQKTSPDDPGWTERDDFTGELRPLAIEWGGQVFGDRAAGGMFAYAVATSLTTVCRELDVELVGAQNTGVLPYWGQMGHYSIGSFACAAVAQGKLGTFMRKNVDSISFPIDSLDPDVIAQRIKDAKENGDLIPLADVPDLVWKTHVSNPGGRDDHFAGQGRTTGPEHPTHFADVDEEVNGTSLLEHCMANRANVSVAFWRQFYDDLGHTKQNERGLLPFRVWQFFCEMEQFATDLDAGSFLCAAGLLAHYVGDACQPLHGSRFADGFPDQPKTVTVHHRDGTVSTKPSHEGAGVHSAYETKMIDRKAGDLIGMISGLINDPSFDGPAITSGREAAIAIVELMNRTSTRIPPVDLVQAYIDAGDKPTVSVQDALWDQFKQETAECMVDGARVLARIWEGAWAQGNGNNIPTNDLGVIAADILTGHYLDTGFVESLDLNHIAPALC